MYQKEGIKGLESKTGKKKCPNKGRSKKKPRPQYEDMNKEELIKRLKINDIFIYEINRSTQTSFKYPIVLKIKKTL